MIEGTTDVSILVVCVAATHHASGAHRELCTPSIVTTRCRALQVSLVRVTRVLQCCRCTSINQPINQSVMQPVVV